MNVPPLSLVGDGHFEVQCSKCERFSLPVIAVDLEHAWSQLLKSGWKWQDGHVFCPECSGERVTRPDGHRS
jgi:hypothetical protein